jgi:hypothetical protein
LPHINLSFGLNIYLIAITLYLKDMCTFSQLIT